MLKKCKPLAMFVEPKDPDFEYFPEEDFDLQVTNGLFTKFARVESSRLQNGELGQIRRVIYSLVEEQWRISAIILVTDLYTSLSTGWHPDLDRVIGILLGYDRSDIERFLALIDEKHAFSKE